MVYDELILKWLNGTNKTCENNIQLTFEYSIKYIQYEYHTFRIFNTLEFSTQILGHLKLKWNSTTHEISVLVSYTMISIEFLNNDNSPF